MQFEIKTIGADNRIARLVVEARDEAHARQQAEGRGLFAVAIGAASAASSARWQDIVRRPPRFALVLFSQELLALLNAGLSLVEAIEALLEKAAPSATDLVLARLLSGLREGKRFSGVLAEQPQAFPALYVGVVRTAEGTSDLPRALARFIEYEQRVAAVRNKVVSAAIYPAILMAVGALVTAFLAGFVVPRFAEVYQGTGRSLPWLSQQMLDGGQFFAQHTVPVLLVVGTALALLEALARQLLRRVGLAGLLARLPGVGERIRIFELSRLYLTLGMLIEGGITVVAAMDIVHGIVSPQVRTALQAARRRVEAGEPLSAAFEAQRLTTPISLRLLRVGERTGNLGGLLLQSATFYDGEISRWIDRFTRSFEPLLMAIIGLVVGLIVVMLYLPIFDLAGGL
ncbi:MAG: type II secretion system F family protein [Microbacteriaceae bacterium]|nr:type II secretion system F family protein [Burkholderiaceae bacterium]